MSASACPEIDSFNRADYKNILVVLKAVHPIPISVTRERKIESVDLVR